MNQKYPIKQKICILVALNQKMTAFAILSIIIVYFGTMFAVPTLQVKRQLERCFFKANKNSKWY
jgi:hypothetical protein